MYSIALTALLIGLAVVVVLTVWAIVRYLHALERVDKTHHGYTGAPTLYRDDETLTAYERPIDVTKPSPEFVTGKASTKP